VRDHLSHDEKFQRMFLDEARIMAQLDHPNIARIHELGAASEMQFIAMELIVGENLTKIIDAARSKSRLALRPLQPHRCPSIRAFPSYPLCLSRPFRPSVPPARPRPGKQAQTRTRPSRRRTSSLCHVDPPTRLATRPKKSVPAAFPSREAAAK
jgi:hypothetical protein